MGTSVPASDWLVALGRSWRSEMEPVEADGSELSDSREGAHHQP